VDDTIIEENQLFHIYVANSPNYTQATDFIVAYAILDDEWRFVDYTTYGESSWDSDATEVVRTGPLFNGTLYGHGSMSNIINRVKLRAWARAEYVYDYYADTGYGYLTFSCDSQTARSPKPRRRI
jgi:hypothetical protein